MDTERQTLSRTFNTAAELYDQMRPGYPEQLIEDVIRLSGLARGGSILELGCGTGQATAPFAKRGYFLLCLDIGEKMIAVASRKFAAFDNVAFRVQSFEEWNPGERRFDLVMAATSFIWIDPEVRYTKTASVLKPTGSLALFYNKHVRKDEGFFADAQAIYRECAPSLGGAAPQTEAKQQVETGADLFSEPIQMTYPWDTEYTTDEYIKLLCTYSGHIHLPKNELERLLSGIRDLIDKRYSGSVVKHYEAVLEVWKKR
jgi:ubiquinone/menaquinone biosynthesis C-methylase UbiE